jgi:hypothetical protein
MRRKRKTKAEWKTLRTRTREKERKAHKMTNGCCLLAATAALAVCWVVGARCVGLRLGLSALGEKFAGWRGIQ